MRCERPIFSQIMDWVHGEQFRRCVNRYRGNYRIRNFSCWDQFLAMAFAQLTYRDSLADIEVCLRSRPDQLYRMGFRSTVAHNTLARAKTGLRVNRLESRPVDESSGVRSDQICQRSLKTSHERSNENELRLFAALGPRV